MIPPQHCQDMVPLLIQTLRKPLRDMSGGDFHNDYRQPGQGGYSKPQEEQPVMAMGTWSTMNMKHMSKRMLCIPGDLPATGW